MAAVQPIGTPPAHEDPVLRALDRAPLGAPLSPEEEAECAQALADVRAGRVKLVPHAQVQRSTRTTAP